MRFNQLGLMRLELVETVVRSSYHHRSGSEAMCHSLAHQQDAGWMVENSETAATTWVAGLDAS